MSEHDDQVAVFQQAAMLEDKYPDLWLLYAVPNAGKRTPRMGAYYKAEGLKPGCLDYNLPVARGGYIGLWIEQKFGKNKPTTNQLEWKRRLEVAGHLVFISRSVGDSMQMLKDYLDSLHIRYQPSSIPAVTKRTGTGGRKGETQ